MMIVDGRSDCAVLVVDLMDALVNDDDLLVDKCANDDFVSFESVVVVVVVGLLCERPK